MGSFSGSWPDFNGFIAQCWPGGVDYPGNVWIFSAASNVVVGANPPYSITDFFGFYPKFSGGSVTVPGTLNGTTTVTNINTQGMAAGQYFAGTNNAQNPIPSGTFIESVNTPVNTTANTNISLDTVNVASAAGIAVGYSVVCTAIPANTTVTNVSGTVVTLSAAATANGSNLPITFLPNPQSGVLVLSQAAIGTGLFSLTAYVGPPLVPYAVINAYINLASASLVYARWLDSWQVGIGLYVAHFLTLYLRSEGNCDSACGQAAVAGLKQGITVGLSAGGVSQNLERVPDLDSWSAWNESSYGTQLATFAKIIGGGPMWCY